MGSSFTKFLVNNPGLIVCKANKVTYRGYTIAFTSLTQFAKAQGMSFDFNYSIVCLAVAVARVLVVTPNTRS